MAGLIGACCPKLRRPQPRRAQSGDPQGRWPCCGATPATAGVLRRIYGPEVRVEAVAVESGVSPQPWGDEETRRGALTRAAAAVQWGMFWFSWSLVSGLTS